MRRTESASDFGRQFLVNNKKDLGDIEDFGDDEAPRESGTGSKLIKRKTWTKSLRPLNNDIDCNEFVEDHIKAVNNLTDTSGYIVESVHDEPKELEISDHARTAYISLSSDFLDNVDKVYHFVSCKKGDIEVVSTVPVFINNKLTGSKVILSTSERDDVYHIGGKRKPKKKTKVSKKDIKFLSHINNSIISTLPRKEIKKLKSNQELIKGFLTLAELDKSYLHLDKSFKIGVICWKGVDSDAYEQSMSDCSSQFAEFLSLLGENIALKGWTKFSGGLDVLKGKDGERSIYNEWNENEIMFHVAPLMESEGHQRKVHIGNNTVVIVFIDSDQPFSPAYIHTTFNQVFIIVQVENDESAIQKARKSNKRAKKKKKMSKHKSVVSQQGLLQDSDLPLYQTEKSAVTRLRSSYQTLRKRTSVASMDAKKPTYYRVSVLRRNGVPSFVPKMPWPVSVFKKGRDFRDWLLEKSISGIIASYQSDIFKERLKKNREVFLEKLVNKM